MTTPAYAIQMTMIRSVAENLDNGGGVACIIYYDDVRPESEEVAANPSSRLVTLNFPKPCVKTTGETSIELFPSDIGMAVKNGTATWARLYNAAGQAVIDLDIGVEIQLDNPDVVLGSTLKLDAIFLEPE